jgi:hypothetical protein
MDDTSQKKVLVITHEFPPSGGSAVQRPLKFVKYLSKFGWKPYVVTPKGKRYPYDYSLLSEIPSDAIIKEVFSLTPEGVKDFISRMGFFRSSKRRSLGATILKIYKIIYLRAILIDWQDGWIPFGVRAGKRIIEREDIDLIYVHGQPPSSFIIGYLLKKATKLPLIIDYDDSWTTDVYHRNSKNFKVKLARKVENMILRSADKILSVKEKTIKEIIWTFPEIAASKLLLITNGFDSSDYPQAKYDKKDGPLVVTYTGKISEKFCYSPESFLIALKNLIHSHRIAKGKIRVIFAGLLSPTYKAIFESYLKDPDLQDSVEYIGFISHADLFHYLKRSHLLLLIIESRENPVLTNEFAGSIPAKIWEYIASGIPILAIVPEGFESELIQKTHTGFIARSNDIESIEKVLMEIHDLYVIGKLDIQPDWNEINKYERQNLTKRLAAVFDGMLLSQIITKRG